LDQAIESVEKFPLAPGLTVGGHALIYASFDGALSRIEAAVQS
jgi:hypothetical protein